MMIRESWGYSDTSMPCQMKEGEALKTVDQLKENAGQRYVSEYSFALVYAGLDFLSWSTVLRASPSFI